MTEAMSSLESPNQLNLAQDQGIGVDVCFEFAHPDQHNATLEETACQQTPRHETWPRELDPEATHCHHSHLEEVLTIVQNSPEYQLDPSTKSDPNSAEHPRLFFPPAMALA